MDTKRAIENAEIEEEELFWNMYQNNLQKYSDCYKYVNILVFVRFLQQFSIIKTQFCFAYRFCSNAFFCDFDFISDLNSKSRFWSTLAQPKLNSTQFELWLS